MAKKQIILFLLIVCLPLATLAWLGSRLAHSERGMVRQRFCELLIGKLQDTDGVIASHFGRRRRELLKLTELEVFDLEHLRQIVRRHPYVEQLFVLEADGSVLHPDPAPESNAAALNEAEREFLVQAKDVFLNKELVSGSAGDDETAGLVTDGWYLQYWGPGLQLIFYQRLPSGRVVGVLVPRARWMADLIADLPETIPSPRSAETPASQSRVCLVDSDGTTVYQWGPFEPDDGTEPVVELPLSEPLGSWRLQYFVDGGQFATAGRSAYFNLFSALAMLAVGLVVAAVYFYREYDRAVREASQRINFVNQVSHELKTPLTSIRMYAELLQIDLEGLGADEVPKARGHLEVIVAESQRLSRLIGNVLTFARQRRDKLTLRKSTGCVDEVIARVIEGFSPAFAQSGIEVTFDGSADSTVMLDVDAVEQILGNLLSNVEKYAAEGGQVAIASRRQAEYTTIEVADRGPGIPAASKKSVFRPFYRLSDRIEGRTGTGIGLSIARQLARLHGGDVTLGDCDTGARFEVRLHTPAELNDQ
ncbi:MAG: HAMP domain-containing sensor histidine kinase [Thermoguttaceae bacterium]